ncbi:MAG: Mut7-C RNAse domain-containing protein [Proteobacteria bacterium]|nr:Mut7-C RNAse domain-containing protein [Pseudomonadota bacterium]
MTAPRDGQTGTRPPTPRFLVDAMLGNVTRDLRLLGYDAAFVGGEDDAAILGRAQREGRILVTRDRELARRAARLPLVLVATGVPDDQASEVLRALGQTDPPAPFSRCLACNGELASVPQETLRGSLPDHIAHSQRAFVACTVCGRAYWGGSHGARLRTRVQRLARSLHPGRGPV